MPSHRSADEPTPRQRVRHLAELARLRLDDAEEERLAHDLEVVLGYVERVNDHLPRGAEGEGDPGPGEAEEAAAAAAWEAEDVAAPGLPREVFLANAPRTVDDLLWVPAVGPTEGGDGASREEGDD
jgi:aspartyl-tRNA(Asn)/glutamyl-tRNA(Gln) amidotransferase subunit C